MSKPASQATTVFISHNKKDKDVAREIGLYLVAENVNVWFDEWEISVGDSIVGNIQDGLARCTHFFILWSNDANQSNWVTAELEFAIDQAINKGTLKIIPIVLDKTPRPPLIQSRMYIKYEGGTEEDRISIIDAVTGASPSQNLIRSIVKKYHEVTRDDSKEFGIGACPECGGDRLDTTSALDYAHDQMYYFMECSDCKWSDWSQ